MFSVENIGMTKEPYKTVKCLRYGGSNVACSQNPSSELSLVSRLFIDAVSGTDMQRIIYV